MNREFKIYVSIDGTRVPLLLILDSSMMVIDTIMDESRMQRAQMGENENTKQKMGLWIIENRENPLPGTDDLRVEFFAAKKELELKNNGFCPSCQLAGLVSRFRKKLEADGLI